MGDRHHYIPQFYLRHWCEPSGALWCFPTSGKPPISSNPRPFAAERGLYDSPDSPLAAFNHEDELAKIESLFASVWPDIFERMHKKATKRNLARFIALLHLRHPDMRETLSGINRELTASLKALPAEQEIIWQDGDEITQTTVNNLRVEASQSPEDLQESFLLQMNTEVEYFANILFARKWGILKADSDVFLTSDRPITLWRGDSRKDIFGFGTPGTHVTFPVSPRHMLVIRDDLDSDGFIYPLTDKRNLNDGVIQTSERFVFSFENDPNLSAYIVEARRRSA